MNERLWTWDVVMDGRAMCFCILAKNMDEALAEANKIKPTADLEILSIVRKSSVANPGESRS